MTALPPITDLTNSTTTEGQAKTWFGNMRGYLSGLFGDDGTKKTANQTLGTLFNKIVSKSAAYTVAVTDLGVLLDCTGTWTLTLLAGATAGDGFTFAVRNSGTGVITLDPNGSETADDALMIYLRPGTTVILTWDGTAAKWKVQWLRSPNSAIGYAPASGTPDAIVANFSPPVAALTDGLTVLVRAGAANANAAPTFAPDGQVAKPIVHGANNALRPGSIDGAGHWLELQYDAILDKWVLKNPAHDVPSGAVMFFAASTAQPGWLKCDGAAISRTTYATLFAVIGTTFGVGDGSTTFNLPDLRGEFIRGWIDNKTLAGQTGRAFGGWETDVFKSHTHTTQMGGPGGVGIQTAGNSDGSVSTGATGDTNETRPRNFALLACIKY